MYRERKLTFGEELQTLFHPIASATKQAAEKTAEEKTTEELAPVNKVLENIDGTLNPQRRAIVIPPPPPPPPPPSSPPSPPQKDLTSGIHATGDGRNAMGNSIVHIEGNTLKVDDKEVTPGLILYKKPRPQHYTSDDYSVYRAIDYFGLHRRE